VNLEAATSVGQLCQTSLCPPNCDRLIQNNVKISLPAPDIVDEPCDRIQTLSGQKSKRPEFVLRVHGRHPVSDGVPDVVLGRRDLLGLGGDGPWNDDRTVDVRDDHVTGRDPDPTQDGLDAPSRAVPIAGPPPLASCIS